jgi:hypothetical protein
MNYNKVQFVSWELNTGPFTPTGAKVGFYSGIRSASNDDRLDAFGQIHDIKARVAFTENALSTAHKLADTTPTTLKVFMAPEFLYRGAGGAYIHDLINGWSGSAPTDFNLPDPFSKPWKGLFGDLQDIAAKPDYANWLFIFGTAISASFPTSKAVDKKYYIDPMQPGEIYNTALIQSGGPDSRDYNYASRKHYISGIDFLNWYILPSNKFTMGTVVPADSSAIIPSDVLGVLEGGALFNIPNVNDSTNKPLDIGLEVCLDHSFSGSDGKNHFGRLRSANQNVKIQLVPSAGMRLKDESIRLLPAVGPTPHSYAFNCDGLGSLKGGSGCHTQIWNGSNGAVVAGVNKLVEASNGEASTNTHVSPVASSLKSSLGNTIRDDSLWNNGTGQKGAGHVRCSSVYSL